MSRGILGGLFDFNNDGKMSAFERASELGFLHHMITEEEKAAQRGGDTYGAPFGSTFADDEEDTDMLSLDLMAAGLDEIELSLMDEDDRRSAIEDAGLDPDDFGYLDNL